METSNPPSPPGATRDDAAEDQQLAARFKAGDAGAFDQLVCAHQDRVARLAVRLLGRDAEISDIVQEIFLSVFTGLKRFRQESRFSTWLTTIAINKCRTYARRNERRRQLLRWMFWARADARTNNEPLPAAETVEQLRHAVDRLPLSLREPVVLRYFEELSIDEISEVLNISTGAVEVRLTRGRKKLKEALSTS
jgi:RNA polymerase sigma factor (sigma-70 family)